MRRVDYFELGATLYIPVINENLIPILKREKYQFLKSIVICFEDSIIESDVENGKKILKKILKNYKRSGLKVFIRPRNIQNLREILKFKNINLIDGFALAKFDTSNSAEYLSIFIEENHFYIMPILETKEVFLSDKLKNIMTELEPFKERVLSIRIGSEDILNFLDRVRNCNETIYEIMPLYLTLSNIINIFKPNGFNISSTVYACFEHCKTLEKELLGDIEHQLFNKTSIHPKQIELIQNSYKISKDEYFIANKLLNENIAVFKYNGRMYEKNTHSNWAKNIIKRFKNFGLK